MRKCSICDSGNLKQTEFDYDYSTECGIDGIVISSAQRFECGSCTHVTVELGPLKEIDEKLVELICAQSLLLTGRQSRFLRVRHFEMDLLQFSKLTEIDTATLEITENENLEHHFENSVKIRALSISKIVSKTYTVTLGNEKINIG